MLDVVVVVVVAVICCWLLLVFLVGCWLWLDVVIRCWMLSFAVVAMDAIDGVRWLVVFCSLPAPSSSTSRVESKHRYFKTAQGRRDA